MRFVVWLLLKLLHELLFLLVYCMLPIANWDNTPAGRLKGEHIV
jgi:hypothetical protein